MASDDASVTGTAGRYATALFQLAQEQNALDPVLADVARFEAMIAESEDLRRLVRSPVFSSEEQLSAIAAILDRAGITGVAANFLKLVARNRRLFAVENMLRGFRQLVAEHRGEQTAKVTVAEPLTDARLGEVRDTLRQITSKDVKVDVKVDPRIIGGIIVQLGSRMVDASVRTKLSAIQHAMKEVR